MPGGFSPVFVPIILAGYVFGSRFGFLMGAFTLLVSGLITGGVGPWLPYQMFASGWVGMSAGWLGKISNLHSPLSASGGPKVVGNRDWRLEIAVLSVFGFAWGLLYGAIINVYFWPFAAGPVEQTWAPGIGLGGTLARYAAFYVATSLGWDLMRAAGNVALLLLLGVPMVHTLARFQRRFHFEVHPAHG
jgi:energy-coupling factor transport system substrate-specific component